MSDKQDRIFGELLARYEEQRIAYARLCGAGVLGYRKIESDLEWWRARWELSGDIGDGATGEGFPSTDVE